VEGDGDQGGQPQLQAGVEAGAQHQPIHKVVDPRPPPGSCTPLNGGGSHWWARGSASTPRPSPPSRRRTLRPEPTWRRRGGSASPRTREAGGRTLPQGEPQPRTPPTPGGSAHPTASPGTPTPRGKPGKLYEAVSRFFARLYGPPAEVHHELLWERLVQLGHGLESSAVAGA